MIISYVGIRYILLYAYILIIEKQHKHNTNTVQRGTRSNQKMQKYHMKETENQKQSRQAFRGTLPVILYSLHQYCCNRAIFPLLHVLCFTENQERDHIVFDYTLVTRKNVHCANY